MLCTNGSAANPYGQCNKSLTPRQDLISEHPEWFFPHPSNCTTDPGRPFCIGTDCQPLCQDINVKW